MASTLTRSNSEILEMIAAAETLMLLSTSHNPSSFSFKNKNPVSQHRTTKKATFLLPSKRRSDDDYVPETKNRKMKAFRVTALTSACSATLDNKEATNNVEFPASRFSDVGSDLETYKLPLKKRRISCSPVDTTIVDVKQKSLTYKIKNTNIIKKNKKADQGPMPPPDMPQNVASIIDAMGGTGVVLMVQKILTNTDVGDHQNRLQIPFSQIADNGFLTEDEKQFLTTRDEKNKCSHIKTPLLNTRLETQSTFLRRWVMGKSTEVYVLTNTWMNIVRSNELEAGNVVQVWAFRVGTKLHLALIKL